MLNVHRPSGWMKRRLIATVWVAGMTIPLLAGAVFLIGCCVLPFHGVIHKLMPLCDMAANVMRSDHADGHEHDAPPSAPAPQKQEPVNPLVTEIPSTYRVLASTMVVLTPSTRSETAYRSYMSLGAARCDQDVGLYLLVETFLI